MRKGGRERWKEGGRERWKEKRWKRWRGGRGDWKKRERNTESIVLLPPSLPPSLLPP